MFYVKHKEIIRNFNFSKVINTSELPGYIKHYIHNDETILAAYKTIRDHGIFTDKKIFLFDNNNKQNCKKQIYSIFYKSISAIDITFENDNAEINLLLDNGYPICLKFIDILPEDKVRLRILYTCINRIASDMEPLKEDIEKLVNNNFSIKSS